MKRLFATAALAAFVTLPVAAGEFQGASGPGLERTGRLAIERTVTWYPAHAARHGSARAHDRHGRHARDGHRERHRHGKAQSHDRERHRGGHRHAPQWTGPGYWSAYRYPYRHRVHPDFAPGWRFAPPPRRWWW